MDAKVKHRMQRVVEQLGGRIRALFTGPTILFGLLAIGVGVCLWSGTGFDLFGASWHTAVLLFPLLYPLFLGTRLLFLIPDGWAPRFRFTQQLSDFREAGEDEILRLDAAAIRGFVLVVASVTVYSNLKIRIPVIHDEMRDDTLRLVDEMVFAEPLVLWLQQVTSESQLLITLWATVYTAAFFFVGMFIFVVYVRRNRFGIRWLSISAAILPLVVIFMSVLVPSVGPVFMEPGRFQWLEGTDLYDHQVVLANVLHDTAGGKTHVESLRAHPILGVAAFPSLRVGLLVVFSVVAARTSPRWCGILTAVTAATAVAMMVVGFNYAIDVVAGAAVGAVVAEGTYRVMKWDDERREEPTKLTQEASEQTDARGRG